MGKATSIGDKLAEVLHFIHGSDSVGTLKKIFNAYAIPAMQH